MKEVGLFDFAAARARECDDRREPAMDAKDAEATEATRDQETPSSSISKTSVEFGGMTGGKPRAP